MCNAQCCLPEATAINETVEWRGGIQQSVQSCTRRNLCAKTTHRARQSQQDSGTTHRHNHTLSTRKIQLMSAVCKAMTLSFYSRKRQHKHEKYCTPFNPLTDTLKPHSNRPLYSNTVISTLAVDGWAVTFGTARKGPA